MPIYEYLCSKGHEYERAEGFDAPVEQTCPTCGERSRRRISVPAVIFKGSGFYSTENRKDHASDNGGTPSSSSDGTSKDGGSEAKAEAATTD